MNFEQEHQPQPQPKKSSESQYYSVWMERLRKASLELENTEEALAKARRKMKNVEIAGSYEDDPQVVPEVISLLEVQKQSLEHTIELLQMAESVGISVISNDKRYKETGQKKSKFFGGTMKRGEDETLH